MQRKITLGWGVGICFPWLLAAYFGYFLWQGNYGVNALFRQQRALEEHQAQLKVLKETARRQEHRVATLRAENVAQDTDMLAEQAQQILGFGMPEEYVVPKESYATFSVPSDTTR